MVTENGSNPPDDEVVAFVDAEAGAEITNCQSADDFYSSPARETIERFCCRILDEQTLTVSELLHSPRHQQAVSNLATFMAILTQADRAMKRKGGINALVNEVARNTRERLKTASLPELTTDTFANAVSGLLGGGDGRGRFLVEAALTQTIQTARTFTEKARLLTDLALSTEDETALGFVDRFLSEIVRSDAGLASIAGDMPFATLVDCVVTLVAGDRPLPDGVPETVNQLGTLLRRSPLPFLSDGLMVAFRRLLLREDRFTIVSSGDLFGVESVQREILELSRLANRLRFGGGFRGGDKTEASLQRRASLLVNEDTLHEIIRGRGFVQKLRILFLLQKMPLPPSAEQAVSTYLRQFFATRDFAGRLLDCWKERSDKLRGVAEVQRLAVASTFPFEEKQAIVQQLDEIQAQFIRTFHVLGPLAGKADPPPEQVLEVLKLAADEAFCKGRSQIAAARALYRQVHRPRFMRAFLQAAGADRTARMTWLKNALGVLGVPFWDLTSLRVLVVDDEPAPRAFVRQALSDMGMAQIDEAVDGEDAISKLDGHLADISLVICDWMMPRASGLDVLRWVRDRRADLPFLMVTALATPKAVQKALEFHVSGYIAKPFTPEQLEDKVFFALMGGGPSAGG